MLAAFTAGLAACFACAAGALAGATALAGAGCSCFSITGAVPVKKGT